MKCYFISDIHSIKIKCTLCFSVSLLTLNIYSQMYLGVLNNQFRI